MNCCEGTGFRSAVRGRSLCGAAVAPACVQARRLHHNSGHRRIRRLLVLAAMVALGGGTCAAEEPLRLTHDGRLKFSPVVCSGGHEIVYVELANPTLYRLTRLRLDDGSTIPLHADAQTSEFEPTFSADGKIYAYLKTSGVLRVNLVIEEVAGTKLGD